MTDPARDKARDEALEEALKRLEDETAGPLRTWAETRQAEVQSVIPETSAADRNLSVRAIEELSGRRLRSRWRPRLAAAAAVAAALAAGWFARPLLERLARPEGHVMLGPQGERAIGPVGLVDDYDLFAWRADEGQRRFGLRVWNDGRVEAALSVDGLTEPRYEPTEVELASLGMKIYWEVVLLEEGRSTPLVSASSWRLP